MNHYFGEKQEEMGMPVWQSPKYSVSRSKAVEIIESGKYGLEDGDFWILMNKSKSNKMVYTGLITSHNACLKINDALDDKFKPDCVSVDKDGYKGSLVYTYCCPAQGIYEVGEASSTNCKNDYPYAMAYKRLFDRVVLKLSRLAYSGVYSEAEADEFKNPLEEREITINNPTAKDVENIAKQFQEATVTEQQIKYLAELASEKGVKKEQVLARYKLKSLEDMTANQYTDCIKGLKATK